MTLLRTKFFFLFVSLTLLISCASAPHRDLAGDSTSATLAATPYMGWNTYYGHWLTIDEKTVLTTIEALERSPLKGAGYKYVWLDAGWWQGARDSRGTITVSSRQWPHGMAYIADEIHRAGFLAGIYTDAGKTGCADGTGKTKQGSEGHYQQDMDTFADWGYDAVKVDWCGGHNEKLDPLKAYTAVSKAVRSNSSNRPMLLNICNWEEPNDSWAFGPKIANSWRTGGDISTDYGKITWAKIVRNFDENSTHPEASGPGHWNDPDYVQVGIPGISAIEAQAHFSLWAIMAAPLILGADIRNLSADQIGILTNEEVLAVDQDPLGEQARKVSEERPGHQIWSKRLTGADVRAVALFNRTESPARMTVSAKTLGLKGHFAVRDLWAHAERGTYSRFSATVPPHGVILLKLQGSTKIK